MPRRRREIKNITVLEISDDIDNNTLDLLFRDVRFIKLHHNENNPLVNDECWIRGDDSSVYTVVSVGGESVGAHRVSYEIFKNKKLLNYGCHHCDSRACINPNHIFDGSQRQNLWDARRKHRMFEPSINNKKSVMRAEKKLREMYPNTHIKIDNNTGSLAAELNKLLLD